MTIQPLPQLGARPARKPEVQEVTDLLRDLNVLRFDPHATDLDWLIWFEAKADLLTRIGEHDNSDAAREAAAHAWHEVDQRRAALELDDRDLDGGSAGGASGRW